jgi:tetratricopeptide (TPR) repeat protein
MRGSGLPEFDNRIIALGNQVVFGVLLPQRAVESVTQDQELANLPDGQLEALIVEVDDYWREQLDAAARQPRNVAIYPELEAAAAERRLKAIGLFRRGASASERPEFDRRMARWIGVTARALLAVGMTRLLFPDPRAMQAAYEAFEKANWCARGLPDDGRLRLREVIWATYGRRIAALEGGQRQLVATMEQELAGLRRAPGREQEAEQYFAEVRRRFDELSAIVRARRDGGAGGNPEQGAEAAAAGPPADAANPAAPPRKGDQNAYSIHYLEQLNSFGGLVLAGRLTAEEAGRRLAESIDVARLGAQKIYFVSEQHRSLADVAPDRARVLGDLNYAVATRLTGDLSELTRGYCAYAIARACMNTALRAQPRDPKNFEAARPWLEEALRILDSSDGEVAKVHCAAITVSLGLCHRGIGDFARARDAAREAIRRHQELPPEPFHRANLGAAFGNLADAEEQLGETASARLDYYRAFDTFAEVRDTTRLRQALRDYARLCGKLGRLDDAQAAIERAASLMTELADVTGAVQCYFSLAENAFATQRIESGLRFLQRAEDLLATPRSQRDARLHERERLALMHQLQMWEGYVRTLVVEALPSAQAVDEAFKPIERARQLAVELGDHNGLASALLQMAMLFLVADRLDSAEAYCGQLDLVPCEASFLARRREILADIRRKQGAYVEAAALYNESRDTYRDAVRSDRLAILLQHLGETYEAMGDPKRAVAAYEEALEAFERHRLGLYEASRLEVTVHSAPTYDRVIVLQSDPAGAAYDPVRALHWLERSKSRVFVEALGLSRLSPHGAPESVQPELAEEARCLTRVAELRGVLFLEQQENTERLRLQQELSGLLTRLDGLWARIAAACPEYDEFRRGAVVEWPDYDAMLAA